MKTYSNYLNLICIAVFALAGCNSNNTRQAQLLKQGIHTVVIQQVVQTSQYTYLRLKEDGNTEIKEGDSLWVAAPGMEAKIGETLYYKGGYAMKDFMSRELNRKFKEFCFWIV